MEYIPYGEVFVEERNSQFSTNFLFNAKELDNETGLYYYGARYLDPTGAMWLSVDPMWEEYAGMSPYNYCAGNPVKLVDPDGRENTVYLVDLQTEKKIDVQKLMEKVNRVFENFGLETRLMMAPDGKNFNPKYMDDTDSYVAIGELTDAYNFIKEKSPNEFRIYYDQIWGFRDVNHEPERSSLKKGEKTSVIGLDVIQICNMSEKKLKTQPENYAAYLLIHGVGHNAGLDHPDVMNNGDLSCMLMNSGNWAIGHCTGYKCDIMELLNLNSSYAKDRNNFGYIKAVSDSKHFGNKKSRSNYEFNKKYPDLYFGKKK